MATGGQNPHQMAIETICLKLAQTKDILLALSIIMQPNSIWRC
jgi:hypothetical protein